MTQRFSLSQQSLIETDKLQQTQGWSRRTLVALLVAILLSPALLYAQVSQANIRGTITDTTGAVIPKVSVILVNTQTQVTLKTESNSAGAYYFQNINPGTYTLQATANGFASQKLRPFVLQVNQTTTLNLALAPGKVTQVVNVQAQGEAIDTASTGIGLTLGSKQLQDIPLDSNNFTELFKTAPGVSPISVPGSQTGSYTTSIGPMIIPSFNGQTQRSNLFVVDGMLDDETFGNAYAVQPIIEAMQNMKLQSHESNAVFGGSTGGTVNMSTKSGTNHFHGDLWEYYKDPSMQSIPYFDTAVSPLHQNQFGADFGGPVMIPRLYNGRNKTFFYGAYSGFRFSSPGTSYFLLPTAAELAGNFSADPAIFDPATTACSAAGNCTRQQFDYQGQLNHVDPSRLNQGAIYYVQHALPAVSSSTASLPGGTNAFENSPNVQSFNQYDFRVDQAVGANTSLFFHMMGVRGSSTSGRTQLPGVTSTRSYSWVGSFTHSFNPNTILHLEVGRTYESRPFLQNWKGLPANFDSTVGFPSGLTSGYVTLGNITPAMSVSGYFGDLGEWANPEVTAENWAYIGDFTKIVGKHTFRMGAQFNSMGESQDIEWATEGFTSQETSSLGGGNTGTAIASYLLGIPNNFTKRNVVESLGSGGVLSAYFQDIYQPVSALTITAGLRYDIPFIPTYGSPGNSNQYTGNFDFNNGTYIVYKLPPACSQTQTAPCIPGGQLPAHVVLSTDGDRVLQNQYNNLQPRVGVAYRVDPNTAIRAGFGIAFDEYAGLVQNIRGVSGNWPSVGQIAQSNINNPTSTTSFPGYTIQDLPAISALPAPTPFNQVNWFIDPKAVPAYSMQYNLGIQRQLSPSTVVSATYVGSLDRHLNTGGYYNVAKTPGPGNPALRRPYPYISPTFYTWSGGVGSFNALELQLVRRFTHGLAATVAYTWSKSMDEGCSGFFGSEGCGVQNIYDMKSNYSVSAFDVPNNLVVTFNYALPIGRGKIVNVRSPILNQILGGWQVNSVSSLHSGFPYSVNIQQDIANIGSTGYERPNLVGDPTPSNQTLNRWLNTDAFQVPQLYHFGSMGRNALRTQFYQDYDLSAFKRFHIFRTINMRVSLEAFNFINHPIFGQPNSTFGQSNFGEMSSTASGQRTTQISTKISF